MEKVINLEIPHVGEHILGSIDTPGLFKYLEVSETWKVLATNVLLKRWKGKMFEACKSGETKVVRLLLERFNCEENGLNIKNKRGFTAFMMACLHGHKEVVQMLLDCSETNLNARSNAGYTPFILACLGGCEEVVKLLLYHSDSNIGNIQL